MRNSHFHSQNKKGNSDALAPIDAGGPSAGDNMADTRRPCDNCYGFRAGSALVSISVFGRLLKAVDASTQAWQHFSLFCRERQYHLCEVFMAANANVIALLNAQLTNELSAINQYFLHARMYRHWGLGKIGKKEYEESIDEMKHADRLIHRILMLEGLPNLQALHKLMIGESTPEMLESDLKLELMSQKTLKDGIAACETAADYVSRDLLQSILEDTEEHIDWLKAQIELIAKLGLENYLQSQVNADS